MTITVDLPPEIDAITVLKDSESAEWEGSGKNVIKIPIGFGHERL